MATLGAELPLTDYETVAASQTDQVLGPNGHSGDRIARLHIVPATTSPGAVSIKDGSGSAITVFTGGAASVADLTPITVDFGPDGIRASHSANTGWKVTTGANVSLIATGSYT